MIHIKHKIRKILPYLITSVVAISMVKSTCVNKKKRSYKQYTPAYVSKWSNEKRKEVKDVVKESKRMWKRFKSLSTLLNKDIEEILIDSRYNELLKVIDSCLSLYAKIEEYNATMRDNSILRLSPFFNNMVIGEYLKEVYYYLTDSRFYNDTNLGYKIKDELTYIIDNDK